MRSIVDAHHHLWDLTACNYPWLMARGVVRFFGDPTPIQKDYLVSDYRSDSAAYELAGSVHIQVGTTPSDAILETQWLQQSRASTGLPTAVVAFCALDEPDADAILDRHQRHTAVRGIRQIVGRSDAEDAKTGSAALLTDATFQLRLGELGARGLSFDLQLTPRQVVAAVPVLAAASETPIALCHAGSPWDQSPAGLANWRAGLADLAALPNVVCKLSGFGMFNHGWTRDSIQPLIDACIEAFGVDRCMFGSNFPVDKLHASFERVYGAYEQTVAMLSDAEQDQVFRANAARFYRIDSASSAAPRNMNA
ncbi:MAG: amidohydrolase family protein [Pseudomonadota bacterium]